MPIRADSERELKAEIQKIVKALDEKQDWTKRIEVLTQAAHFCRSIAKCKLTVLNDINSLDLLEGHKEFIQMTRMAVVSDVDWYNHSQCMRSASENVSQH